MQLRRAGASCYSNEQTSIHSSCLYQVISLVLPLVPPAAADMDVFDSLFTPTCSVRNSITSPTERRGWYVRVCVYYKSQTIKSMVAKVGAHNRLRGNPSMRLLSGPHR